MPKKLDLLTLALIAIASSITALILHFNFLSSTIVMFGLPSLWLAYKTQNQVKKVAIFSLLFSIPFTFVFDYLISKDQGWYVVNTLFPYRLFNIVAIEQFAWGYLFVFYVTIFYEYFLDKKSSQKDSLIKPGMKWLSLVLFTALAIFIYFVINFGKVITLNYAYVILGTSFGTLPLLIFLLYFPRLTKRFLKAITYFSGITILNEYVSLSLQLWTFPGNNVLGKTVFFGFIVPYEEVFFYFIIAAPLIFAYYEFFDDDRK